MGQKSSTNDAAAKDVQAMLKKEECALGMVQKSRSRPNYAAAMDAQTKPSVEECVVGTGRIAIHKTNLLHLDHSSRLPRPNPYPISVLPELSSHDQKTGAFLKKCPSFVKKLLRYEYLHLHVPLCCAHYRPRLSSKRIN